MKLDRLIFKKIIKITATRCQILRIKCTKFDFGWGYSPDPARGAYSAPLEPLAGFEAMGGATIWTGGHVFLKGDKDRVGQENLKAHPRTAVLDDNMQRCLYDVIFLSCPK